MGKISLVSAKYIIHASIDIKGAVDRPDVIGAIFGQTEGLLGSDLELRELQKSGRIGRIEVNVETRGGKTNGSIVIPSSLDKAETSIVGAALEIIERIGPCDSKIKVERIEDVRISKRSFVVDRAKDLLKHLKSEVLPNSEELTEAVAHSVRQLEIQEYGTDRLPAGPAVAESEEVIIVEGRADVLNLLKHGIKNTIAMNGTSVPNTIKELSKTKIMTALVDGDRGGDLIVKELMSVADLDSYSKAPSGKEIEELSKKEIFTVLSAKLSVGNKPKKVVKKEAPAPKLEKKPVDKKSADKRPTKKLNVSKEEKDKFKELLEDIIGSRAAVILDKEMAILGKVPISELSSTIKNIAGVHAVVFDGQADELIIDAAEKAGVSTLVAMDVAVKKSQSVNVLASSDL